MFNIKVTSSFSSAHQLREYKGLCENLHGHNWKVQAVVSCTELDKTGMAMDFHDLKHSLNKILDTLDHKHLNDIAPFNKINPTSENLAEYIFQALSEIIDDKRVKVSSVSVWETETSCAEYTRP